MELNFTVNKEKCIGCAACVKDCVCAVLEMRDGAAALRDGAERRCIGCQHCLAICPTGAISVFGKNPAKSDATRRNFDTEQIVALYKSRRSCRKFKHKNVSHAKIKLLVDTLAWTPTGHNDHRLHVSVVDNIDVMDTLRREISDRLLAAIRAKTLPLKYRQFRVFERFIEAGEDIICRTAPHVILACAPKNAPTGNVDAVIALAQFETLAVTMGISTTWCGYLTTLLNHVMPDLAEKMGVPPDYKIHETMLFGIPAVTYPRTTQPAPVSCASVSL